jgi:hypothetical protein
MVRISIAGGAMAKITVLALIIVLFVITMALFATLYEIKENELTSHKMFFMSSTFLGFTAALYIMCDEGHYISNVVRLY